MNIENPAGGIDSVYPCTEYLTFGPWIYLVPQYKPRSVLMLGYAGGTAAGLIRLFYGDVPITAVDLEKPNQFFYDVDFVQADAQEFVEDCGRFDCIIVDVWDHTRPEPCGFVSTPEFAETAMGKCDYLIVAGMDDTDMSAYPRPVKVLSLGRLRFHYIVVNRVAQLPIR